MEAHGAVQPMEVAILSVFEGAAMKGVCAAQLADPTLDSSQPSSADTFASLLAGPACSPTKLATTSSQRSAGTVSGGEVAQAASALAPAASLKRSLSSCTEADGDCADSQTSSQGWSKSHRSSVEAMPARRAAAARARAVWAPESGDEAADSAAGSGDDGLEFLLRACEMLDPHLEPHMHVRAASVPNLCRYGVPASAEGTPKITRQARHGVASLEASPAAAPLRRPVSRRLLARGDADDWEPGSDYDGGDDEYLPAGRRPARASARAVRASARATASASSLPPPPPAAADTAAASPAPAPGRGRWGGEPKQLITGPCMNPECEHPHESPQWRKGPPQYPVLCNACGTRWLRNGTLKPLVPRRGLRYKNKGGKPGKGKTGAAAAQAAAAAAQAPAGALLPPCPSPAKGAAAPAHSSKGSQGGLGGEVDAAMACALPVPFNPAAAFGPAAVFGGLDPAAAAEAAAAAFKQAQQMFAASSSSGAAAPALLPPALAPWGFFAPQQQQQQQQPGLLAPAAEAGAAAAVVKQETAAEQQPQADAAMALAQLAA